MIFVTMLVYPLNSAKRFAAERCLWALFRQLGDEDVLLTFEKTKADREEALRLKPKVMGLGLAAARKDEWTCFVDVDIEFRDGFVKRLKEFLSGIKNDGAPTLVVTRVWEKDQFDELATEDRIREIQRLAMIGDEWEFYFGTGMMVANKAFLAYIDEWQMLTDKSQYYPDETSLVTLAHKYRDKWQLIWLPDDLHYVGWKVRGEDANAAAVHIGNAELTRWLKTATEVKDDAD
ncbi:hypothetical protein [Fervidibacter sp.]|jgi:hypothetical protein